MRASLPGCSAKGHQFLRMDDSQPQFLEVGAVARHRRIACRRRGGKGPALLWLSGFLSDMGSTKATFVEEWAAEQGLAMMRFDYSGHGLSEGDLLHATIGDWLEESIAVWELMGEGPRIVIGSSMGGWIALLLARHLARAGRGRELAGLVLIAPAFDMTETLMWHELPQAAKDEIERNGATYVPSAYGDPYPITRHLIEEGRSHLIEGHPFDPGCPVRILQGMHDPDVPWRHALALVDLLAGADVELTLIKGGDHRLSAPQDLQRLTATIATLVGRAG
jgi:pimeloyl-ACP methyl ester carboxylesterase